MGKNVSFRKLYGVRVPVEKYEVLKKIADLLVGETTTQTYIWDVRYKAVELAIKAVLGIKSYRLRGPEDRVRKIVLPNGQHRRQDKRTDDKQK